MIPSITSNKRSQFLCAITILTQFLPMSHPNKTLAKRCTVTLRRMRFSGRLFYPSAHIQDIVIRLVKTKTLPTTIFTHCWRWWTRPTDTWHLSLSSPLETLHCMHSGSMSKCQMTGKIFNSFFDLCLCQQWPGGGRITNIRGLPFPFLSRKEDPHP